MEYKLRKLTLKDAENLSNAANNPNVSLYLRNVIPYPFSVDDAVNYINFASNNPNSLYYGIDIENKACGCVCVCFRDDVYSKSCEIGFWFAETHWRKGLMTKILQDVCSSVFEKYDIERIDAEVFSENTAARRVLEKIGFDFEGLHKKSVYKNGRVMDTVTYALLKN